MPEGITVSIEPYRERTVADPSLAGLTDLSAVRERLTGSRLEVADFRFLDREPGPDAPFRAVVHDPDAYRSVEVTGRLGDLAGAAARAVQFRPLPGREEFERAVEAVRGHAEFGPLLAAGGATAYRPMPPLADVTNGDGTVDRVVTVGLRTPEDAVKHRIIGVRAKDGTVVRDPEGVPAPSARDCVTTPAADNCPSPAGGPRAVRVRVRRGTTELWDLVVNRPATSSGSYGSGVELRFVAHKGERVLYQAHAPILNVRYAGDRCGPYRDWEKEEVCFNATGSEPAGPGYRLCTSAPRTILDTGNDQGDFRGVAFFHTGSELRILSELAAGWYRYVTEWRLADDGAIRPRFGFGAVTNPCTCLSHTHHVYWRLDPDVGGTTANRVDEFNDGAGWTPIRRETQRTRDPARHRQWRVVAPASGRGYGIVPGAGDGTADAYGVADLWVLRYRGAAEIDDPRGFDTRAHIGDFVNGESVDGQDLVVWYGAHFLHDQSGPRPPSHFVGPELRPLIV
ncbi:hypothetical protein [Streptosporangium nondiastaticum]|uniref:hypothetical protein n=1 Tax=Streptosporangium nondiastaticum TaxID=35764 RepID=UPI0011B237DD|nr:hypothetical protein [Streptosporangium nondiastaticum]